MPAFSTHYIFAKEMMSFLKTAADFELNEDAVFLGTQGPDIFFFHRVFPWLSGKSLRKYGSMLHRVKPESVFEEMRTYCKLSDKPDIAKSYTYGFMLHYALDRICHPYVYSLQNEITKKHKLTNPHTAHNMIEFSIDAYLLNKRLKIANPSKFDTSKVICLEDNTVHEIAKLLHYSIPKIINKNLSIIQAETAFKDLKSIQRITFDPIGYKRIIITLLEIIAAPFSRNFKFSAMIRPRDLEKSEKYANIKNKEWKSPCTGSIRFESFEDLFEYAKHDAANMILSFQKGISCRDITENKSFLTGVEVK